ncbi:YihY/virulence factor BrkB family protein [Pararhodobacter sp.]|uniref:YihY/virulence factor BrkB family protein n=1 Tax=Pararhodobacter sp. TaxID=2127056 RepID=UPI002AFDF503|nr:YihY/virulence factor BrkB family protein [Pararhodobacter sp.]
MARGRQADTPAQIPASGWKDIALRVKDNIAADHLGLIAAGVAFYALLAIFPAIAALMALGGLVLAPAEVAAQLQTLTEIIPEEAAQIIMDQAVAVTGSEQQGLGVAFGVGLVLAIYSASKGMGSLMQGLNVAYNEREKRGFVRKTLWTLALTLFLIVGLIMGLLAALAVPVILSFLILPDGLKTALSLSRWVILAAMTVFGLAVIYRYGPSRRNARWKWLSVGSVTACVVWILASIGFSIYVRNFGSYNETFGSVAGVIVLLMWLWISAFILMLGAVINAEIEAQTAVDSTVGPDRPMGQRGAKKADILGEAKGKA